MKTACGKIYLGPGSLLTMLCIFHKIGNTIQKQATTKRKLGNMSRLDLKNNQTINMCTCFCPSSRNPHNYTSCTLSPQCKQSDTRNQTCSSSAYPEVNQNCVCLKKHHLHSAIFHVQLHTKKNMFPIQNDQFLRI